MKRTMVVLLVVLSSLSLLAACSGSDATSGSGDKPSAPEKFLKIGSGPMGSGWYPITTVMLDVYMDGFSGLNVSQVEGGSTANLKSLESGDIQLGLNYTSDFTSALDGGEGFDEPLSEVSAIGALYPVYQTIATTKDHEDINSVEDIVDKHIFLGPKGGGGPVAFWNMMAEYGIDESTIEEAGGEISYGNYSDGASMLKDNNVDVFVGGGAPFIPALQEIEITKPIKVIPIEEDKLESIEEKGIGIASGEIPADTYKDLDKAIPTYTMVTMVAARSDLEEEYAYNMTKLFWENIPEFESQIPERAKNFTVETALDGIDPETLHPGAKKYYEEVGALE
ncbi:TAXI family TRAP transporter solute-binding subunit [Halobacillus karajensis]|uniref:TRAP transporter solute receptor, TAXI family n=1 Tax=Halobacillus karajensis TaxID=195088 RepID=A0A024P4W8_9BACI|nr:TAXI family TRAP transporter solute-binding subunit [Halobacillus karajensis]CDQ19050.1 TRAP transporter solute receptor, TAXI family [Halobacillus karajensis]CDQ22876.1 TRAP transporter solute receptor, TAXI family [Halobacillus karajensis]CDQ26358.1 TRAP transporter solute receptor, TAXI family [Halobacillus karajensis]